MLRFIRFCFFGGLIVSNAICATTLTGTVSDSSSGAKLANVIVSLRSTTGSTLFRDTTDATGAYSIANVVTPGALTLRATLAGYVTKNTTVTIDTSVASLATDVQLVMVDTASVVGMVTDSVSGAPVTGAIVSLGTGFPRDTTKSDGIYTFAKVASGSYSVSVTASAYVSKSVTVVVSGTAPITANVPLVQISYATISGAITDSVTPTTLISGAIVTLRSGNTTLKTDTTKADGTYSFDSVATGAYTVRAIAAHYVTKTVNDSVKSSAPITSNIALAGIIYATISGTVVDSATPTTLISGAIVGLRNGNATVKIDTTKADGAFTFDSVATGTYTVVTSAAGYVSKTENASVPTASPVTVSFALVKQQYGSLSGLVKDSASGTALKGAVVSLRSGYTTVKIDTTGADGSYSFDSIPVGVYTVRATDSSYTTNNMTDSVKVNVAGTMDFLLVHPIDRVLAVRAALSPEKTFSVSSAGLLTFGSGAEAGVIKVFSLSGKLLYKHAVRQFETSLALPANLIGRGNAFIIRFSGIAFSNQKKMVLP